MHRTRRRFAGALPIRRKEFKKALLNVLEPISQGGWPRWLGIAVSGGVDSMALALLCSKSQRRRNRSQFHAFVVDHKARRESTKEAWETATILGSLGLRSNVLTLRWPDDVQDPGKLPNFESLARKLRYQALGRACRDHGIQSLLLAHHADDQAETVLMRIVNGYTGPGLEGIKPFGNIPECWGIHGVHDSGAVDETIRRMWSSSGQRVGNGGKRNLRTIEIEHGGIKIHRPLLGFSKERLIHTCIATGTTWTEDLTNGDPTVTQRNAIRQLLNSDKLPSALRKPALLATSASMRQQNVGWTTRVNERTRKCEVESFDVRSGKLVIRVPDRWISQKEPPEGHRECKRIFNERLASYTFRNYLEIVSPLEHISLHSIRRASPNVFPPSAHYPELGDSLQLDEGKSFCVAGVEVKKLASGTMRWGQNESSPYNSWLLTRQPYHRWETTPIISIPPSVRPKFGTVDPLTKLWHLWDGRYWIRVINNTPYPVTVRPYTEADNKSFRDSLKALSPRYRGVLDSILAEAAPGKVRWTLPALVAENGRVLALPTLGLTAQVEEYKNLSWQIRYKKIVLGRREEGKLMKDIEAEEPKTEDEAPLEEAQGGWFL